MKTQSYTFIRKFNWSSLLDLQTDNGSLPTIAQNKYLLLPLTVAWTAYSHSITVIVASSASASTDGVSPAGFE